MAKLANLAKSVFEKIVYMIRAVESSEYGKNGKFCKNGKKKGKNEHYTKTCNGWLGKF